MLGIGTINATSDLLETFYEEIKQSSKKSTISLIKENNLLAKSFLSLFGLKKTIEITQNIKPNTYKFWSSFLEEDTFFVNQILEKLCTHCAKNIVDYFCISEKLSIKDKKNLCLLVDVIKQIKPTMSLSNLIDLPENYLKEILYNKDCFSDDKKINIILNASKNLMISNVLKNGNLFINTSSSGYICENSNCSNQESCMYGLFYNDMQYIDSYCLSVNDLNNNPLKITESLYDNKNTKSFISLGYEDKFFVRSYRKISDGLYDEIEVFNNSCENLIFNLNIISQIRDIFYLRGNKLDTNDYKIYVNPNGRVMVDFIYKSGNKYSFYVSLKHRNKEIEPSINIDEKCTIRYNLEVASAEGKLFELKIVPIGVETGRDTNFNFPRVNLSGEIKNMNKTINRCIDDLDMLTSFVKVRGKTYRYLSAGLPRYATLFGRDSIISALFLLEISPDVAKDTIELLANFQGKSFEDRFAYEIKDIEKNVWARHSKEIAKKSLNQFYTYREEEKGKFIHEIRFGELSKTGDVPHSSYYGTIDATPLWLILLAEYYKKTKDTDFLKHYLPNVQEAILWIIDNFSDGYLKFVGSCSLNTIQNQGWKDANDSLCHILDLNGKLKNPSYPVALAEVQAYVYKAFYLFAEIFDELGMKNAHEDLNNFSKDLKQRFNNDFYLPDKKFFAIALDAKNRAIESVTSNIGHCLAFDLIDDDKKSYIEEYLMSKEMFSGYGIRTLSNKHEAYDPLSYHNGSVWVHDTLINTLGLSRESQENVLKSLFDAANHFPDNHMPELFAGFSSKHAPVLYPDTCIPQAWASAGLIGVLYKHIQKHGKPSWISSFEIIEQ